MTRSILEPMYAPLDWRDEYADNPFIQALGEPLEPDELREKLVIDPGVPRGSRILSPTRRQHVVQSISNCFFPRTADLELGIQMDIMLRCGYLPRNPTAPGYQRFLNTVAKNAVARFTSPFTGELGSSSYPCFLVYGPSGNGKTTGLKRVAAAIAAIFIKHDRYRGSPLSLVQIPIVHFSCPPDGSPRGVVLAFLQAVDTITGVTTYFQQDSGSKNTAASLVGTMAQIIATFGIGLLVVDEIHHLANYRRGGGADESLDFLVKLSNCLQVPMVLAGTYRAITFLEKRFQNARRACEMGSLEYGLAAGANDKAWRKGFLESLWKYQWTKESLRLDDEVAHKYFALTQSVASVDVLLFKLVQQRAARQGAKSVTMTDFVSVFAQKLRPLHKALNALSRRHTDTDALADYEDLRPPPRELAGLWASAPGSDGAAIAPPAAKAPDQAAKPAKSVKPSTPAKRGSSPKGRAGAETGDPDDLRGAVVGQDRLEALRQKKAMGIDPSLRLPGKK